MFKRSDALGNSSSNLLARCYYNKDRVQDVNAITKSNTKARYYAERGAFHGEEQSQWILADLLLDSKEEEEEEGYNIKEASRLNALAA